MCSKILLAWARQAGEGVLSSRGALYWRKSLEAMHEFMTSDNIDTLLAAVHVAIWKKFPKIKKKAGGPTMGVQKKMRSRKFVLPGKGQNVRRLIRQQLKEIQRERR